MTTQSERTGGWPKTSFAFLAFSVMTTAAGAAVSIDPRLSVILLGSMVWCGALALGYLWMRHSAGQSPSMTAGYAEAFEQVAGAAVRLASESESLAQGVSTGTAPVSPAPGAGTGPTAAGLASDARQLAKQSAEGLKSLKCTASGSDGAAGKIGDGAQAVEEIAFQANLLALSAAVEAALPSAGGAGSISARAVSRLRGCRLPSEFVLGHVRIRVRR